MVSFQSLFASKPDSEPAHQSRRGIVGFWVPGFWKSIGIHLPEQLCVLSEEEQSW
jgi:hypothetical protein